MCYSRYDDERDDGISFFRGVLNAIGITIFFFLIAAGYYLLP